MAFNTSFRHISGLGTPRPGFQFLEIERESVQSLDDWLSQFGPTPPPFVIQLC